jgi:ABC-type multidrug transport system fused ATPase/permease subunit
MEKLEKNYMKININNLKLMNIFYIFRFSIIFSILLYVINDFSNIFSPYLMCKMFKTIESFYIGKSTIQDLIKINIVNTSIWVIWIFISFFIKSSGNFLLNKIEVYVKKQLFNFFQVINYEDFIKITGESAINNLKILEYSIKEIFSIIIIDLFTNVFSILVNIVIIYRILPNLAYLIILWSIFHFLFLYFGFTKNYINSKKLFLSKSQLNNNILETILNILMIKSNNTLKYENHKLDDLCENYMNSNKKFVIFSEIINHTANVICEILLWGGGFFVILKILIVNKMPISTITYLFMVMYGIIGKVRNISIRISKFSESIGDYNNIFNYLNSFKIEERIPNKLIEIQKDIAIPVIEFKNVSLFYGNEAKEILKNISFKIYKNQKVCFIGASGSGKSTIANLISGLYKNYQGEIFINGHEIKNISVEDITNNVSIINQNPTIFSRTVKENLIADKKIEEDKLIHYTKIACIYDFIIEKLSDGFETKINQKTISGGQAQRLCLARLLLREKNIKIFDEATNGLDKKNKEKFLHYLLLDNYYYNKNKNEKNIYKDTIIFIDHSLEFLDKMDKIILLNEGKILLNGSYEEIQKEEFFQYFIRKNLTI